MNGELKALCRHVLRRVRYATNTLALLETRLPPEGPFDAALTNALVVIVSSEWPEAARPQDASLPAGSGSEPLMPIDIGPCPTCELAVAPFVNPDAPMGRPAPW